MKKKYKIILASLFILLILSIGISISYSFFDKKVLDGASLVETDEYISINYLDGKYFDIHELKKDDVYTKKISVTNISNSNTYLTLSLMDVSKTSDNLYLKVLDSKSNIVYDKKITNIDTKFINGVDLEVGKTLSYTIIIENKGEETTNFYANILAFKELVKQSNNNFKDSILTNNKVSSAKTKIGEEVSLENEGLIKTIDDDGESYYFRGNVNNNYVKFNDILFRIVRINGDSTVRLVLNDVLENQVSYSDNNEEKENYTDKLLFNDSTIKVELDKWLSANFSELSKYIALSTFCEDVNTFTEENNTLYLNNYNRIFKDNIPSLTCMGNKIKANVGLLTADEVEFAGANKETLNGSFYLYNENINGSYWTMSGSQILENYNVVDAISVNKNGSLSYDKKISTPMYVRPVISLDSNTTVTGLGTIDDPYIVKTN